MSKKIVILSLLFLCLIPSLASAEFYLPDTGQTLCYDASGNVIDCTGAGGAGQDGAYSLNPMFYADNGDGTVTDNNTGLMWQKCSAGQDDLTCGGTATTWNWYQATGTHDDTYNNSVPPQDVCGALNQSALGGHTDWRLPSSKELITIVDYGVSYPGPTIAQAYFPNTVSGSASLYWSSTPLASSPTTNAWYTTFDYGAIYSASKGTNYNVRCVRGDKTAQSFKDNGNNTVTDNRTGLTWQKKEASSRMPWAGALSYCEGLSLGGHKDWRIPNAKEFESLTDDTRYNPSINTKNFPNTSYDASLFWWSSTTLASSPTSAWYVAFGGGTVWENSKDFYYYVRCVRGGNSRPILSVTKSGTGAGTVTSSPPGIDCGTACTEGFASGAKVTLTPVPDSGSIFANWTGDCNGTGKCVVTMSAAKSVEAVFNTGTCTYTISPKKKTLTYKGGTINIVVTAKGSTSCPAPDISQDGDWIGLASTFAMTKGKVKLTIPEHDSSIPRTGTVTIGGSTFTVTQKGQPCALALSDSSSGLFSNAGGTGSFTVTATPSDCAWTATPAINASTWVTITSGGSGTGSGEVDYSVAANSGKSARNGKIRVETTLNKKSKTYTVRQSN